MSHPPSPGPTVQPNFAAIMEAVAGVQFPITKAELLREVGEETVIFQGSNVALHDLIKEIHDDAFESDAEFLDALSDIYATTHDGQTASTEGGVLPSGPPDSWQTKVGQGDSASYSSLVEPPH